MTPERIAKIRNGLDALKRSDNFGLQAQCIDDLLLAVESLQADNARLRAALEDARYGRWRDLFPATVNDRS